MPALSPFVESVSPELSGACFDAYISLGDNCEAGLEFTRIGYAESSFFRFTSSLFESTYRLIDNDFGGIYRKENLVPVGEGVPMVRDVEYDIVFHSNLPHRKDPDTPQCRLIAGSVLDEIHAGEMSKIRHFIDKWNALTRSDREVLYFVKLPEGPGRILAGRLLDLFSRKYPGHRFTLLFLQTEDRREPDWGLPRVLNRYLPRFAPWQNAHDSDHAAWDRIFAELPLRKPVA
jgi:hypothetical protein